MKHRTRGYLRLLSAAAIAALTTASAVSAATYGLVVGVSDYEFLDADLRGPANDVRLVSAALRARGAQDITVLAAEAEGLKDGVSYGGAPTRAAIIAGLEALAAKAAPGDTVVFYFSGHGSQMPDASGDEAGGYDEILLPSDAKNWRGAIGAVENALVDDELAVLMQGILDTGAQLVAILDACHSATGFRALPDPNLSAARYIDPALLNVPDAVPGDSEPGQIAPPLQGDFVFLYSSQSDQRSFEYPIGDPAEAENWYGDFTRALMPVLESANGISWSQALLAAIDGMAKDGPAAQTPDAEGPLLNAALFGSAEPVAPVWQTDGNTLTAGLLSGIEAGAQVAVYASADTSGDPVIAQVATAKANSATLARTPGLPRAGYARMHLPAQPAPMKLGLPVVMEGATPGTMSDTLAQVAAALDGIEMAASGAPDYVPVLTGDSLALAGRDGVIDGLGQGSSPRIAASASRDEVAAFLDRASRAHRMRRALALAEGSGAKGFALPGAGLTVTLARVDVSGDDAACGDPGSETEVVKEVRADACDQLWLTVKNGSKTARDITVLYIDRDFNTIPIYPEGALSNRLNFGETEEIGLQITNPSNLPGAEELIVLASPAEKGAPRTVLTALADGQMRDIPKDTAALGQWLFATADPETKSRNFSFGGALPSLEVTRFRITLVPTGTQ